MTICDKCLIVFAREPETGKVKTRLKKRFSEKKILELYKKFIRQTINLANRADCDARMLAFTSTKDSAFLKNTAVGFKFFKQRGRGLGERMHNAFKFAKAQGARSIIIIGTDSPTLPVNFLNKAFRLLAKNDLVLGPSTDGGYYLIGLNRPCPKLFKGIKWSTDSVLGETLKKARAAGLKFTLLEEWYDIDEPEDLDKIGNRSIAGSRGMAAC